MFPTSDATCAALPTSVWMRMYALTAMARMVDVRPMRAAVLEALETFAVVDDLDLAPPGPGEVQVRVHHCGVCHSDLHFVDGSLPTELPSVLGHEAGGVVEAVGPGVLDLAEGDKVILTLRPPCGRCYWCVRGEFSICPVLMAG